MSFPAAGSGTYYCHCLISWHWQLLRGGILIDGSHNDVRNSNVITSSIPNSTMIILDVFHSSCVETGIVRPLYNAWIAVRNFVGTLHETHFRNEVA